ncbi:MAG: YkgJ family cysteine cluster protein [Candidatus Helarchaeota archaeon]
MNYCLLCAKCCAQTEMLLSNEDIKRITSHIHQPRQKFSYIRDGYVFLKNENRYCVFLDLETKKCSIYEIRPVGCRFYPIIYNPYTKRCVIDRDCSNKNNIPKKLIESLCPDLRKFIFLLEEERNTRLKVKLRE